MLPSLFTTADAATFGITRTVLNRGVSTGRWRRIHRGVYAAGDVSLTALGAAAAVVMASGGVASHVTAARVHGLWVIDSGEWATIRPTVHRAHRQGLRVHRSELAPDEVVDIAGVAVTTVARTIADLARRGSRLQAICALESAVRLQLISPEQFVALKTGADRRLAARARASDPRSESPLETAVRLILQDAGFDPVPQWSGVDWRGIEVYRIDLALPRWRLAIECDGAAIHGTVLAIYKDRWRANRINLDGWQVLRFTWWDVTNRPGYIVSTVRTAVAAAS